MSNYVCGVAAVNVAEETILHSIANPFKVNT